MTRADLYQTWEVGSKGLPPPLLAKAVQPPEHLLWAAEVPVSRFLKRWMWLTLVAIPATVFFARIAPWGQSMAEYCAGDEGRSCLRLYLVAWPGVLAFAYGSVWGLYMLWKANTKPWLNYFGVTTVHAMIINGHKPHKVQRKKLDRTSARIDWADAVRFDNSRSGLSFVTLDFADANRAVYWANEGRFSAEFQKGPIP
jgi:hypothetical protein